LLDPSRRQFIIFFLGDQEPAHYVFEPFMIDDTAGTNSEMDREQQCDI
jgi:hypothetical protein